MSRTFYWVLDFPARVCLVDADTTVCIPTPDGDRVRRLAETLLSLIRSEEAVVRPKSTCNNMAVAENKEAVRRLMEEVLARGEVGLIPELVAADYVAHLPIGDHYGPEGVRIDVATYRSAFPDLDVQLEDLLADGDKVVRRFTVRGTHSRPFLGITASGKPLELRGIAIDRLAEGRLVESWVQIEGFLPQGCRLSGK